MVLTVKRREVGSLWNHKISYSDGTEKKPKKHIARTVTGGCGCVLAATVPV